MDIFDLLGFRWDRTVIPDCMPTHFPEEVCTRFYKMMPQFAWNMSVLEGNPLRFLK